jgi:hypothetical protein
MASIPKKTTPEKIDFPDDSRKLKAAQDPKTTYQHKTRSGHVFEMNDTEEGEHVTMQHRTGSMVQFQPDGKILITSHDGMYTAVFGENRLYITGAHDIVVEGDASLKVKGDYNLTVDGNFNTTVSGDMQTLVGGNKNLVVVENQSVVADSQTTKIANNTEHTSEGTAYIGAHEGVKIQSTAGNMHIFSVTGMVLVDPSRIDLNPASLGTSRF